MAEPKIQIKVPSVPRWLMYVIIIAVVASWVPLAMIVQARVAYSERPRIHIFQDMGNQPFHRAQAASATFADGRAMRLPVAATIARGQLRDDDHFYRGYQTDGHAQPVTDAGAQYQWFDSFPQQIPLSHELLRRGMERYNIFCAACHGHTGRGDGLIHQRAVATGAPQFGWVQPSNLHARDLDGSLIYGEQRYPAGKMFAVISEGIRSMPPYAAQMSVEDRWAVVAYVYALQFSQNVPANQLPQDLQPQNIPQFAAPVPQAPAPGPADAPPSEDQLVEQGRQLYTARMCFTCHQVQKDGPQLPGPSLFDVANKPTLVTVGLGGPVETVMHDFEYFKLSIREPLKHITVNPETKQPYPPIMVLPVPVSDAEIDALWAYVKSLTN